MVAVQRVPDDDEAVDDELEWHGAFDRAAQPVAGLADAEQLLAGGDGGLDRPAVRVAGDDAFDAVAAVGGEESPGSCRCRGRGPARCGRAGLPNAPYQMAAVSAIVDGIAAAVARHRDPAPVGGGGESRPGMPNRWPFSRGRPRLPVRGGAGAYSTALAGSRVVNVVLSTSSALPW